MKKILTSIVSFAFILTLAGCNCNKESNEEINQGIITVPQLQAYLSKDISGDKTLIDPFNTSISLTYFYQSDKEAVEDYFKDEYTRLHQIFDRHYYYFDNNGNLINNLRVLNEADSEVSVDQDLIDILKEGIRFTKLSQGAFNIGVGNLSDLWDGFIEIGSVFTYVNLNSVYRFSYENGEYTRNESGNYLNYYGVYVDISEMKRFTLNEGKYLEDVNGDYLLFTNLKPSEEQIYQAKLCTPDYQNIENYIVINEENNTVKLNKPSGCNGEFSITLGALAKSYVAEKISKNDKIKEGNFLLNAGGSTIKVIGDNLSRENGIWNIAITDSYQVYKTGLKYASLLLKTTKNKSISTSSGDENHYYYNDKYYHHIIDPITGYPNQDRLAITALGDNAMYVDIVTTTLMSMNMSQTKEYLKTLKNEGIEIGVVIQDKENDFIKVYVSKEIKNQVSKRTIQTIQDYIDSIPIEELDYES